MHRWFANSSRAYWIFCAALVLLSLPGRLASLGDSLWLDEAWVANSLLTPTLRETLFFDRWAQSTPPLFLILSRSLIPITGFSEPALRLLPLVASLAGLGMAALFLRRCFSSSLALLGVAVLVANYWPLKYGQQVKQYGTDFLVAAVLMLLAERLLKNPSRFWIPMLGAAALPFLSFIAVFWLPSLVILSARTRQYRRTAALIVLLLIPLALNYFLLLRPNFTEQQFRTVAPSFFDPARLGASLLHLHENFGRLLFPLSLPIVPWLTAALEAVLIYGALRALRASFQGDHPAQAVLFAALLPLITAILVSSARLYPLLDFPRYIIWTLPCCVGLLCYALAPLADRWPRASGNLAAPLCLGVVLASQFVIFAYPRPSEENREAVEFLRAGSLPSDLLFVHGGMYEQFVYYRRRLAWSSGELYLGNTTWPCCALNRAGRSSSPAILDLNADVAQAAARAKKRKLWLLLPGGVSGHWSSGLAPALAQIPSSLAGQGCLEQQHKRFGQTLVLAFTCE